MLLGMIGLPACLTAFVSPVIYPMPFDTVDDQPMDEAEHPERAMDMLKVRVQHVMLLCVCAWLLVIGPCDNLFKCATSQIVKKSSDESKKTNEEKIDDKKTK